LARPGKGRGAVEFAARHHRRRRGGIMAETLTGGFSIPTLIVGFLIGAATVYFVGRWRRGS
jgi:hypothetical protein